MNKMLTFRNFTYTLIAASTVIIVSYIIIGSYHLYHHNYFNFLFDLLCVAINTWCVTVQLQSLKLDKLSKELKDIHKNQD